MRTRLWTIALLLCVSTAHAQNDEDSAEGDEEGAASGGSLDAYDPVDTETSDKGPYRPKGKTGKLADEEDAARMANKGKKKKGKKEKPAGPLRVKKPIRPFAQMLIGFGDVPDNTLGVADNRPHASAFTFILGGMYDVQKDISIGLKIPWSTANMDQLDDTGLVLPDAVAANALGAPELYGEYILSMGPRTQIPIGVALGVPIAQGTPDPSAVDQAAYQQAQVNQTADAFHGWHDSELFLVKRLPFTPQAKITYKTTALDIFGQMKFIFGIKVGGTLRNPDQPPEGSWSQSGLSFRHVTGGGVNWHFLESPALALGLDSWLVWSALDPIEFDSDVDASRATRFQFVAEPRFQATFGPITPSVGYLFMVGGRLGDASVKGVRLRADLEF